MTSRLIGVGLYTVPEAARIVSCAVNRPISRARLARWLRVFGSQLGKYGSNLLSFSELIEMCVTAALRREGLSFQKVRVAYQHGQLPFDEVVHALLQNVTYKNGEAVRFSPLGKERSVVIDPDRSFGKPVNRAAGVATAAIFAMHLGKESHGTIAQWYGVTSDAVADAIEYESALAKIRI